MGAYLTLTQRLPDQTSSCAVFLQEGKPFQRLWRALPPPAAHMGTDTWQMSQWTPLLHSEKDEEIMANQTVKTLHS